MAKTAQSGQALLIILLVMAVILTIGLSVVARSITDITISRKGEEAARAFSAAEAGIEQILVATDDGASGTFEGGSFTASKVDLSATGGTEFVVPSPVSAGEAVPVWFVEHNATTSELTCSGGNCFTGSTIKVCWGEAGTSGNEDTTPAIEVSVLYTNNGSGTDARVARAAYDPKTGRGNGFSTDVDLGCTVAGRTFAFAKTVDMGALGVTSRSNESTRDPGPQTVRLRLLYNTDQAHSVGLVADGGTLPTQGRRFESTGYASNSDATRKVEVYQLFSDLPPIFDFAVFSGTGGIVK